MAVGVSRKDQSDAVALITQAVGARVVPEQIEGKRLVIKLGGGTLTQRQILEECLWLRASGASPVIIHGGGPTITAWLNRLQIPVRFKQGLRVTDAPTLDVVRMVLCGQINQKLVVSASQMKMGGKVVGLNGADANLLQAHVASPELGVVGEIDAVSPDLLTLLLAQHYLPIIAPLAQGPDGTVLNINADLAAASVAEAIGAETLLFVSDVPGICRADGTHLSQIREREARQMLAEGTIGGGMIPKVQAAFRIVEHVPHIQVVNGALEHVLLQACIGRHARGTTFLPESAPHTQDEPATLVPAEKHHQPGALLSGQKGARVLP